MTIAHYVGPLFVTLTLAWFSLAALYDVRWRRIPDKLLGYCVPFAVAGALFHEGWTFYGVQSVLLGGGAYFVTMLTLAIITRGIGGGDVKMGGVVGLAVGWPGALIAFSASWIAAGVVGAATQRKTLPMAPLLLVGAVFALTVGRM